MTTHPTPAFLLTALLLGSGCAGTRVAPDLEWLPDATGWSVRDVDDRPTPEWVLYERDAPDADVKEFRIVGRLEAHPDTLARAVRARLLDDDLVPDGMHREVLSRSEDEVVVYGLQRMPFPFDDREATERMRFDYDPRTGVHRVKIVGIDPGRPPPSGVLRIPVVRTRFLIAPTETGESVLVVDTVHDIGGRFPNWIIYGPICDYLVADLAHLEEMSAAIAAEES